MSVKDILKERMAFSFEVFPPKTDKGMVKLCSPGGVLDQLYELRPDYISCTYGAGGTNVGKNLEVLDKIKQDGKAIPLTHFTCIGNTKEGRAEICTMRPSWSSSSAKNTVTHSRSRSPDRRKATLPAGASRRTFPSSSRSRTTELTML